MPTITAQLNNDGQQAVIRIDGRFDFSIYKEFRDAYLQFEADTVSFVLDLSRTEYMDSSALGMILLLKEYIGDERNRLEICNARPEVEKILRIANFDKLMDLRCY